MSAFDFMCFSYDAGGSDYCFVANAKKHSKRQALEICLSECDFLFAGEGGLRKPTIKDVADATVAYRLGVEGWGKTGCYTFVDDGSWGSFPVRVIDFSSLAGEVTE